MFVYLVSIVWCVNICATGVHTYQHESERVRVCKRVALFDELWQRGSHPPPSPGCECIEWHCGMEELLLLMVIRVNKIGTPINTTENMQSSGIHKMMKNAREKHVHTALACDMHSICILSDQYHYLLLVRLVHNSQ